MEFTFRNAFGLQPATQLKNFFTGISQEFCKLLRNSNFEEPFSIAASGFI